MTAEEYAKEIGVRLRAAHNSKSQTDALTTIQEADDTLQDNKLSADEKVEFWQEVRKSFYDGHLLVEKQGNSQLHALMQSIMAALDARDGKQ